MGSFNLSKTDWNNQNSEFFGKSFSLDTNNSNSAFSSHVSLICANNLYQMVTFPTQVSYNTLDILITSNFANIIYIDQKEPFVPTCNHDMVEFKLHPTLFFNKIIK